MGDEGEWNVGQLVRQKYDRDAVLIGFTTYSGTVTAASKWDAPAELKQVHPALPDSYESLFHEVGLPSFMLTLRDIDDSLTELNTRRLERATDVIYRPKTERVSHYFYAQLPQQFEAVIHIDQTRAVEPLERNAKWETSEAPETFPSGF